MNVLSSIHAIIKLFSSPEEKVEYPKIDSGNENQMELTANNHIECSFSYTIKNNIFTSKELSTGCMCCAKEDYHVDTYSKPTLDELIETLPEKYKKNVKWAYTVLKRTRGPFREGEYKLYGVDILERITGIKHTDVVCNDNNCYWFGSKNEKLDKCPEERVKCPEFGFYCKIAIKKNKLHEHKSHKCNYCEFITSDKLMFKNHLYNCLEGTVRCKDCYWTGRCRNRGGHQCVLGGSKTNYVRLDLYGNKLKLENNIG
jgi:hypothetical protein